MNKIMKHFSGSIEIDTGEIIPISEWPENSPGQPYRKSECLWTGNAVIPKTTQQLVGEYKEKKFKETNDRVCKNLCYIKKTKKLEDITTLFNTKKKQMFATINSVDVAISEIIIDLFE